MKHAAINARLAQFRPLLTPQQNQIVDCIASGWECADIRDELGLTMWEIKVECMAIRRLLCVPREQLLKSFLACPDKMSGLTRRETEIWLLRQEKLTLSQIAALLGISPHTVRNHWVRILAVTAKRKPAA